MPEIEDILPAGAAPVTPPPEVPTPEAPATAEDEIRIGDRTFKTQTEAFAYAQEELQRKNHEIELAEAYRAGISDVTAQGIPAAAAAPVADPAEWETRFYADPKGTLQELREQIKQEVLGTVNAKSAEQEIWSEFHKAHPDLEGFDEITRMQIAKHESEIKVLTRTKGKAAAFSFLAQKTRAMFQDYSDRAKPRTSLQNGPAQGAPRGQTNVTPEPQKKKPVDFLQQIRSLKK